jgi:GNAT superfamily N-acetyltransferase
MIVCRNMERPDIDAGLALCRAAQWNQTERDWKIFLYLNPGGCRVAVSGDNVVGTVTTIRYPNLFSWIGMVLVDPAYRRKGIGIQLLQDALDILKDEETIKLDATPEGREVYLKLDFVDKHRLSRMHTIVDNNVLEVSTARPVKKKDIALLATFDRNIFGADRQPLLEWWFEGAPQFAFVMEEGSVIQGYCLGRTGYNFTHIGPVVANDVHVAKNLVSAALQNSIGQPVIVDALHFDADWLSWLSSIGFKEQRSFIRMYRGANAFHALPAKQFAIAGPEFG